MSNPLTPAEITTLEQLNAARTQGEWRYKLRHEGNPHWAYLHTGRKEHDAIPVEDAAFIVTAANNMPKLLATIKAQSEVIRKWQLWCDSEEIFGLLLDAATGLMTEEILALAGVEAIDDTEQG